MTTSTPKRPPSRSLRLSLDDPRVAGLFWQILVVGIAIAIVAWLWSNAVHNLSVRRISTGFAFLGREAGMPISDSWIDYTPKNTYLRAFIVGLVNTLRVAVIGIVLATVIGTLVGIARLSTNWLLSRLAAVYVEVLRDLPLLLQLLFWYVLMQGLPAARQAWKPVEGVFLSNRGLILPSVPLHEANLWTILALIVGVIVFVIVRRRLIAQQMLDGKARPAWPYALALIVALPVLVSFLAGASWSITLPELRGFNFVGGLTLAPEYFALLIALVTYTSAFIAEIVRSGIQAVPRGQWDAAKALGLKPSFSLQHIVLPQALRVVVPSLVGQILDIFNGATLVFIIGLTDFLRAGQMILADPQNSSRTYEIYVFLFAVYLAIGGAITYASRRLEAHLARGSR